MNKPHELANTTRTLVIHFVAASIEDNILGTAFFRKFVRSFVVVESMSVAFGKPHESNINCLSINAPNEKDYIFYAYKHTINFPNQTKRISDYLISYSSYLSLTLHTIENDIIFLSIPHPCFNTRLNSTFKYHQLFLRLQA